MKKQFPRIGHMVCMALFVLLTGCVSIVNQPSVDAAGHVVPAGPHIKAHPIYWAKVSGKWVAVDVARTIKYSLTVGASTITPPLPSDYGATVDASASLLFATAGTDDVNQNQVDDCYLLAVWDSLLRQNPKYASSIMVRGPPASNSITFRRNLAAPVTVQTDSRISSGALAHPSPTTGAIDACVLERAYCQFRTGANTVASINFGFPGSVMTDLGISNLTLAPFAAGTPAAIIATLAGGNVCAATTQSVIPAGIPIDGSHCYSVIAANAAGITLRNPWGCNGQGLPLNPPNSTVTINWDDFRKAFNSVSCGTAYTALPPPPSPPLPPLTLAGNFPPTLPAGAVMNVAFTSNADHVQVSDVVWKFSTTLPANGSFTTGVVAGDTWTFTATRAADGSTLAKTVSIVTSP